MTRPTITVKLRLPQDPAWRVEAMRHLKQSASQNYTEFRVQTPRAVLTQPEQRALALEVCRPFGESKTRRGCGA